RSRAAPRTWTAAVCMLAATMIAASAQEMQPPRLAHIHPDWNAVATDLGAIVPPTVSPSQAQPAPPLSDASAPVAQSIADLNRATGELFPNIAASPVPVLLPFDTAGFLNDRAAGTT